MNENNLPSSSPNADDSYSVPMFYVTKWYGELLLNFRIGVKPVLLEWSKQTCMIRVIGTDGHVYLSLDASQVTGSELTLAEIKLKVANKWHLLYYRSPASAIGLAGAQVAKPSLAMGVAQATDTVLLAKSGINDLQELIQMSGGKAVSADYGRAIAIGASVFFVLIAGLLWLVLGR